MISGGTIMVLGAAQALFFALLLLSKKKRTQGDLFLITYLILLVVHLAYYYAMFFIPEKVPISIGILGFSLVILHTPFFFLYVKAISTRQKTKPRNIFYHTLWYICLNLVLLISYQTGLVELAPRFGFLGIQNTEFSIVKFSGQFLAIVTLIYTLWGFWMLRRYQDFAGNTQSNFRSQTWLRFLVVSFMCYFLAIYFVLTFSLHNTDIIDPRLVFYYVSFIIMAYVFVLGFFGVKRGEVFSIVGHDPKLPLTESKYQKSGLSQQDVEDLAEELRTKMQTNRWFLEPDLSLPELAAYLDVKAPYLSQTINQKFNQNFFDFINEYRVEEVKKRIKDSAYQHLSILGIALECGFKSKSSFNKSFKKSTGLTPSQYRNL